MFEAGANPVHGVRAKAVMAIRVQVPLGSYNMARPGSAYGRNARARLKTRVGDGVMKKPHDK